MKRKGDWEDSVSRKMFQKPLRVKVGLGIPRYYALGDVWNTPRFTYDDYSFGDDKFIKMFEMDPTPFDAKKLYNVEDRDVNRYNNYDQRDLTSKKERAQWENDKFQLYEMASYRENPEGIRYKDGLGWGGRRNDDSWGGRRLDFNKVGAHFTPQKKELMERVYDQLEREERERGFPNSTGG
jgi:hypothetical protein